MALGRRRDQRRRNRVLASKGDQELLSIEQFAADALDLRHGVVDRCRREIQFRQREHAVLMNVGADFLVPELDLRGGQQQFSGPVPRALAV